MGEVDLKDNIRNAAEKVADTLSIGLSKETYTNAFIHEINKRGLKHRFTHKVSVYYDDVRVGEEEIQLVIEESIGVEVKNVQTSSSFKNAFERLKYLAKLAGCDGCVAINFVPVTENGGATVQVKMN